jgi:hypothetical protein
MTVLYDARGNEITADIVTANAVTDVRPISATLGALNAETVMQLNGQSTVAIDLRTAAGNLTVSFEATVDGSNWLPVFPVEQTSASVAVTTTAGAVYHIPAVAYRAVRVRVSTFASGTIVVSMRGSIAELPVWSAVATASSVLSAANTAATLTIPASGAGLFHYVTSVELVRATSAAVVGTALLAYSTTNLPGPLGWTAGNAIAIGQSIIDASNYWATPIKSSVANTATTIVAPAAGAGVLCRITATYYVGA